ncbi:hypothetical protein D3C86_2145900 [compost metagenome]
MYVKPPCPLRPEKPLMTGKGQHINSHAFYINRKHSCALSGVYKHPHTLLPTNMTNLLHRHNGT